MEVQVQGESSTNPPLNPAVILAEGKRCLAAGEISEAIEWLQEACSLLAKEHGEMGRELAEPYYLYGKALLDLSRKDNQILGNVREEDSEDEEEEEEEDDDAPGPSRLIEVGSAPGPSGLGGDAPGPSGLGGDAPGPSGLGGDAPGPSGLGGGAPGPSGLGGDSPGPSGLGEDAPGPSGIGGGAPGPSSDGKEDESDLTLAWEVLELARVICEREEGKEGSLKLADIHLTLGEVAMESDQYDQALQDLLSCLRLREAVLEPSDRALAEVHFNLGLLFSLIGNPAGCVKEYGRAKVVLKARKDLLSQKEKSVAEEDRLQVTDELRELEDLIPDLDSKIAESEEALLQQQQQSAQQQEDVAAPSTSTSSMLSMGCGGDAGTSDISHLVRKKSSDTETPSPVVSDISHLVRKKNADGAAPQVISDISHLMRKKRPLQEQNPEEEKEGGERGREEKNGEDQGERLTKRLRTEHENTDETATC